MANANRICAVADAIDKEVIMRFDMGTYHSTRFEGDVRVDYGCVCGYAIKLFHKTPIGMIGDHRPIGEQVLGLSDEDSRELFGAHSCTNPIMDRHGLAYVTSRKADVPNALRWMVSAGIIDWSMAFDAIDEINGKIKKIPDCPRKPEPIRYVYELETV